MNIDFRLSYGDFIASKTPKMIATGVEPTAMPAHLFDFQAAEVARAIRLGRAATFWDTGLGKTLTQLEWCRQAAAASNGMAILFTPLAVAKQIEREGLRFGYDARVIRDQSDARIGINICNYDRMDKIIPDAFGAVSLDESSVLKNMTGATTRALITAFSGHRFRLCSTATPAPNDHMELGTHAEFLGLMSTNEMLSRWFVNDTSLASQQWRLKGHAVSDFWDWVASWASCAGSPTDLGFDGTRHILPPMNIVRHQVQAEAKSFDTGMLFAGDVSATDMHAVKRATAAARAAIVAGLVASEPGEPWVLWCDSDAEADALRAAIPEAVEVRGSHTPEKKEATLADFADGKSLYLVAKPSSCGFGLNWQHSARMAFIGRSFSYEAWFQAVRRCWRFGQTRPVTVHLIVAEGEDQIGRVIDRKASGHDQMRTAMAAAMKRNRVIADEVKAPYLPTHKGRLPSWLNA